MTEQRHAIITSGLAGLALTLLLPAAITENGWLVYAGLLVGGITIAFIDRMRPSVR